MSDPASTTEIEDVLSSIRRLVSNGQSGHDEQRDQKTAESVERLVLTPSLRVDDAPAEDEESAAADESQDWSSADAGDLLAAQIRIDEDEADTEDRDSTEEAQSDDLSPGVGDASDDAQAEAPAASTGRLGKQAATFEVMVAGCDDQWEPDGSAAEEYSSGPVGAMAWQDDVEEDDPDPAPSSDPDQAEADEATSEKFARDWQSRETFHHREDPLETENWETSDALVFEDAVLDEDALRDLVADIVRQELQGVLGERITRNVRKLVRREIHRALTSQDFD